MQKHEIRFSGAPQSRCGQPGRRKTSLQRGRTLVRVVLGSLGRSSERTLEQKRESSEKGLWGRGQDMMSVFPDGLSSRMSESLLGEMGYQRGGLGRPLLVSVRSIPLKKSNQSFGRKRKRILQKASAKIDCGGVKCNQTP